MARVEIPKCPICNKAMNAVYYGLAKSIGWVCINEGDCKQAIKSEIPCKRCSLKMRLFVDSTVLRYVFYRCSKKHRFNPESQI